jgi:hypothetical protein
MEQLKFSRGVTGSGTFGLLFKYVPHGPSSPHCRNTKGCREMNVPNGWDFLTEKQRAVLLLERKFTNPERICAKGIKVPVSIGLFTF